MKKLFLVVVALLAITTFQPLYGQSTQEIKQAIEGKCEVDEKGNVTYKKVFEFPGKSKDEIYDILQSYFAYTYNDANEVMQVEDKTAGLLVAKGLYGDLNGGKMAAKQGTTTGAWHIIRIDIKEGKIRILTSLTKFEFPQSVIFGLHYDISEACPISSNFKDRSAYTKIYYKAHSRVLAQFEEIERAVKNGNTSKAIEQDW